MLFTDTFPKVRNQPNVHDKCWHGMFLRTRDYVEILHLNFQFSGVCSVWSLTCRQPSPAELTLANITVSFRVSVAVR